MKLKKFLLRYEPPGVGLEVEQVPGQLEVKHKDLPEPSEVSSVKTILELVDTLIADSPEILTRKKHRPALVQLLGRLYNIEVIGAVDEADTMTAREGSDEKGEEIGATGAVADVPGFQDGQRVVLIGLKGKMQVHNGEIAIISKAKADKDKYEVTIPGLSEPLRVKGSEHMVSVAPYGTALAVGTQVAIRGLRNHIELNGCLGRIVECHEENHRFEVRATESGQLFRVKQDNLTPIDAPLVNIVTKENREPNTAVTPRLKKDASGGGGTSSSSALVGDAHPMISASAASLGNMGDSEVLEVDSLIQLHGLQSAKVFNGQIASITSVDQSRGRYEIRLQDGSVKTVRAENVKLISSPAPGPTSTSSPRRKQGGGAGKQK